MPDSFRFPFRRSNNYLGAYRVQPNTKAALSILEDMEFEAFAGKASVSFAQSGALLSSTALSGSQPVVFGQSGAFGAGSGFQGTSQVVFGQSGDFTAGSLVGDANFSGTVDLVFGQTGTLSASSGLVGASPVIFGQNGGLGATTAFAGTNSILFGQTGNFVAGAGAGANADFIGSTGFAFDLAGTLSTEQTSQATGGGLPKSVPRRLTRKQEENLSRAIDDLLAAEKAVKQARTPRVREAKVAAAVEYVTAAKAELELQQETFAPLTVDLTGLIAQLNMMIEGQSQFMAGRVALLSSIQEARLAAQQMLIVDDDDMLLLLMLAV